ncbi:putative polyprotein [Lampyris noctiluca chuvirus-like virus 1]|uniref:RNA-directed RNA polymerase n=1 Tax=Lampyris noctiluca chuvirus-like virus 1 TaxID=2553070 RepID=A0A482JQ67_9VIRU|nr:putative polyprotein [Lampyris noctiluca chuvirus-like virus 1]QBP37027.1 putative polyprotein [Lampyris noctiluca chuvirus-like virus 1]
MEAFISQTQVSYEFPSEIIYEKKFDIALRNTFLSAFEDRYQNQRLSLMDKVMLAHIPKEYMKEPWSKEPTFMGVVYNSILRRVNQPVIMTETRRQHNVLMEALMKITDIQFNNMLKNFEVSNKRILIAKMKNYFDSLEIPFEVRALIHFSSWMTKVIDKSCKLKKHKGKMTDESFYKYLLQHSQYTYNVFDFKIIYGEAIVVFILEDQIWIAPQSAVVMIQNKVADAISVLLFAKFNSGTSLPVEAFQLTLDFIKELAILMIRYKNNYYTVAKALESLCIAESISIHEEWKNSEFLYATAADIMNDTNFDYMTSRLRDLILSATTPMRHQLCCLGKLMGHPYVDMEQGARKLHAKTTESYSLNFSLINDCINHIKLNYIKNHIMRHKRWPPSSLDYGGSMTLTQAYVRNKDPNDPFITSRYGPSNLADMNFVRIEKNLRFYKLENVIPYLKDKTITLMRSKVFKYIFPTGEEISSRWEETRLLLTYLLNPSVVHNHVDYIDRYSGSDDLSELLDYLVIRIVPKEKELKIDFRGFGCKTYEDRFRTLAQEKNAMRFLDDYSDEQAMTLSELEILRRLSTFRHLYKAYPGHKIIYINVDAKAWNNHFRAETVDYPLDETLDKIFGTTIFGKTHLAYNKTFFYVPGFPSTYYWDGQAGGIEGLNQDDWVIIYLGQIKTVLDALLLKYHCLCKGDDLRIAIAIPPYMWKNREMSDIKNDIVGRLSLAMKSFGHEIKIIESYGSSKYFSFSKNASIGEVEMPQGFRKIQKCYGASNALIATLDEYIGSTFSNAHSTCKVEPCVLPAYLVALYWSLTYLITHPIYTKLSSDELTALLLMPSLAGGFPIIYLHNMAVRAESDLLSPFIEMYSFCKKNYPSIATSMESFMHAPIHTDEDSFVMLYKDPYSIPHDRPPLPSAVLRRFILPILTKYAKQEDVKELIAATKSPEMEVVHQVLRTASVFNVKVLSAIYASTPEGILDELIRKFESARSINELMIRSVGSRRSLLNLRKVVRSEKKLQLWRRDRLRGKNLHNVYPYYHLVGNCPAYSATVIRKYLWTKDITGITMPPLQHQIVLMTAYSITTNKWINENHFTYTISDPDQNIDNHMTDHYSTGPFKPFLGYSTRNGMTEPTVHFIEKDPMLVKVKNLIDLLTWTNTSEVDSEGKMIVSNCPDLIRTILGSFTSVKIEQLSPFSGTRRSGTIQHHVRAPSFREAIVPNVVSNVYTRVLGESNTHIRYRTSKHHYYVNFLHVYCYSIWMAMLELEFSSKISTPRSIWAVSNQCNYCNRAISDTPIVFDMSLAGSITLHPLSISKLGQVAENILRDSLDQAKDVQYNVDTRELTNMSPALLYQAILQEILEQTYLSRKSVQIRYNTPNLTDEAYQVLINLVPQNRSRDVGQSELKRIPLLDLAQYIAILILHYSSRLLPGNVCNSRSAALSILPGESTPWYGLLNQIHKAGALPELVLLFSRYVGTPHATCFYNPVSASRFICRYSSQLLRFLKSDRPLVVLSYYTESHLTYVIEMCLTEKVFHVLRTDFSQFLPKPGFTKDDYTGQTLDDMYTLYKECLVVLSVLFNIESIAFDLAKIVIETKQTNLIGIGLDLLDVTQIDDMITNEDGFELGILEWMRPWEEAGFALTDLEGFDDWENIQDRLYRRYQRLSTKIHFTNIGHCCLALRSMKIHESDDSDNPERLPSQKIPTDPDHIVLHKMEKPFIQATGVDYVPPILIGSPNTLQLSNAQRGLSVCDLFATIGSCTGSETHLLYILQGQRYDYRSYMTNPAIGATCFADGFGGFTSVLMTMFRYSTIIFHTLPEDNESPTIAPSARMNNCTGRIYTDYINEGYSDLSLWSTYDRMRSYNVYCDFVTSDLELGPMNSEQHLTINLHIFKYYLDVRTRDCWLIIKLDIAKELDVAIIYDLALHHCLHVALHSPRSSDSTKYVYLIGKGWRRDKDNDVISQIEMKGVSGNAITTINRYLKQVMSQNKRYFNLSSKGFDVMDIDPGFRNQGMNQTAIFPDRVASLLLTEFDFPIIIESSEETGDISWRDKLITAQSRPKYYNYIDLEMNLQYNTKMYVKSLWDSLKKLDDEGLAVQRHVVLCKIFKVVGYRGVIRCYHSFDKPMWVSLSDVNASLRKLWDLLSVRDRRNFRNYPNYHSDDYDHEGMRIHYFSNYRKGVTLGLALLGTLSFMSRDTSIRKQIEETLKLRDRLVDE